jgi:hypothetical protein
MLFEEAIYPSQEEYRKATENYLRKENPDFFKRIKNNQWVSLYERNICASVSYGNFVIIY